jgi:hypothetical protein
MWHSLDLCFECIGKIIDRGPEYPKHHTPAHNLLQLRTACHRRTLFRKERQALEYLQSSKAFAEDNSEQTLGLACHLCDEPLERPAWRCLDCEGELTLSRQVALH